MDNQLNPQEPISKQTPVITGPAVTSEIPSPVTSEIPTPAVSETNIEPELPQLQPQPEIEEDQTTNEYREILNQYSATQAEKSTLKTEDQEEPTLSDFGITPKPPQNNIFKILFIFALIIFVLVATAFAFVYFKNKTISSSSNIKETTPTPVVIAGNCSLNGKNYAIGESFVAADGCNTCTCEVQDTFTCTDKECLGSTPATKSATITPIKTVTPTSTPSAKKSASASSTTK